MPPEIPEKLMATHLLTSPAAQLPEGALKTKCSNALVMLNVTIDESGKVVDGEATSGFDEVKEPALLAVKKWTYVPFERGDHAIRVRTKVSLFFLGDGESFPMYTPDGNGGIKGGNFLPLPPGCGNGPTILREPSK